MEICFLGTASCLPSLTRGVSSVALRLLGRRGAGSSTWIFDAGTRPLNKCVLKWALIWAFIRALIRALILVFRCIQGRVRRYRCKRVGVAPRSLMYPPPHTCILLLIPVQGRVRRYRCKRAGVAPRLSTNSSSHTSMATTALGL